MQEVPGPARDAERRNGRIAAAGRFVLLAKRTKNLASTNGKSRGKRRMKVDTSQGHPEMDYTQHESTYAFFLRATVVVTIVVICIVAFLAIFVA
jgi:hypothetical protein